MGKKLEAGGLVGQMQAYVADRSEREIDVFQTTDGYVFVDRDAKISDVNTYYKERVDAMDDGLDIDDKTLLEIFDSSGALVEYSKVLRGMIFNYELEVIEEYVDELGDPDGFEKSERDGLLSLY